MAMHPSITPVPATPTNKSDPLRGAAVPPVEFTGEGRCSIIAPLFLNCLNRLVMLEINQITRQIKDMQGRLDALRGYL